MGKSMEKMCFYLWMVHQWCLTTPYIINMIIQQSSGQFCNSRISFVLAIAEGYSINSYERYKSQTLHGDSSNQEKIKTETFEIWVRPKMDVGTNGVMKPFFDVMGCNGMLEYIM